MTGERLDARRPSWVLLTGQDGATCADGSCAVPSAASDDASSERA